MYHVVVHRKLFRHTRRLYWNDDKEDFHFLFICSAYFGGSCVGRRYHFELRPKKTLYSRDNSTPMLRQSICRQIVTIGCMNVDIGTMLQQICQKQPIHNTRTGLGPDSCKWSLRNVAERTDQRTLSSLIGSVVLESSLFRVIIAWIYSTNGHRRCRCRSVSFTDLSLTKLMVH